MRINQLQNQLSQQKFQQSFVGQTFTDVVKELYYGWDLSSVPRGETFISPSFKQAIENITLAGLNGFSGFTPPTIPGISSPGFVDETESPHSCKYLIGAGLTDKDAANAFAQVLTKLTGTLTTNWQNSGTPQQNEVVWRRFGTGVIVKLSRIEDPDTGRFDVWLECDAKAQ